MKKVAMTACIVWMASVALFAQGDTSVVVVPSVSKEKFDELKGKVNGMEEDYLATKATVDKLAKIKISGYVQAQYRAALNYDDATDSTGKYKYLVGDAAGGNFKDGIGGQLEVRRGRLKITYDNSIEQAAIQLDALPSGVTIKEAWAGLKEPWLKTFGLRVGVMDRPIGFEPCYSSGTRETPEGSRVIQTLLPQDYDLGAMLEIQPSEKLPEAFSRVNIRTGLFTGNGINVETDNNLDWIGRIGFTLPFTDINLAIDGGIGGYIGSVTSTDTTTSSATQVKTVKIDSSFYVKSVVQSSSGRYDSLIIAQRHDTTISVSQTNKSNANKGYSHSFDADSMKFIKSGVGAYLKTFTRSYFSADMQVYYDIPVIGGISVRGEFLGGVQPGNKGDGKVYTPGARLTNASVYTRNFMGYYVALIQNINPIKSQLLLKYDVYDPNTDVEGTHISAAHKLTTGEMKYSTIGGGLSYYWGDNVKLTAYAEHVMNEKVHADLASPFSEDVKDDVLTFRVQYKF